MNKNTKVHTIQTLVAKLNSGSKDKNQQSSAPAGTWTVSGFAGV